MKSSIAGCALFAAAGVACSAPEFARCTQSSDCPAGAACSQGVCQSGGGGGSTGGTDGGPGGGGGGGGPGQLSVTKVGSDASGIASTPAGIDCGANCSAPYPANTQVTLKVTSAAGATFIGWSGDCTGTAATAQVTVTGTRSCTASFSTASNSNLAVVKLGNGAGTVTSSPAGISCGATCAMNAPTGTAVTLTAAAATGSQFGGWAGDCAGSGATSTVTLDANKVCKATFAKIQRVAFHSTRALDGSDARGPNAAGNIWRVDFDASHLAPVTRLVNSNAFFPSWSPDGLRVAFGASLKLDGTDANATYNIWRADLDGTNLTPLTSATANGANSSNPDWSHDGARIVFHSSRALDLSDAATPAINIWVVSPDKTGLSHLTASADPAVKNLRPRWSRDDTRVVFSSNMKAGGGAGPASNIWRVDANGANATALTSALAAGVESTVPDWSPDGTRIVFASTRAVSGADAAGPTSNVWRVNADGTGLVALTTSAASGVLNSAPRWSPDGTRIVFHSKRALDGTDAALPVSNLWLVNADGSGAAPLTRVTAPGADSTTPSWTSDGGAIVFNSARRADGTANPEPNVWRINPDGTGLVQLTAATAAGAGTAAPTPSP